MTVGFFVESIHGGGVLLGGDNKVADDFHFGLTVNRVFLRETVPVDLDSGFVQLIKAIFGHGMWDHWIHGSMRDQKFLVLRGRRLVS